MWSDFKVGNCILVKLGGTYWDGWVYYSKNPIVIFILVFTFIVVLYFKVWELRTLLLTSKKESQPIWKRSARLVNFNLAGKKVGGRSQTTLTIFWHFLTTYPLLLTVSTLKSWHFWTTYPTSSFKCSLWTTPSGKRW